MTDGAKIFFEGIPLSEVVDRVERREIAEMAIEEANKFKPAIISNIVTKPRFEAKVAHGKAKVYDALDRFGYLIEKGSDMEGMKRRVEFRRFPKKTQDKLNAIFAIIKSLPDEFVSNEVVTGLKARGVGDPMRYILMLYQGGFLSRSGTVKKFTYSKTDVALLSEEKLANEIMDRRDKMWGYNQAAPGVKAAKSIADRAKEAEEAAGLQDIADTVQKVDVVCINGNPCNAAPPGPTPPPPPPRVVEIATNKQDDDTSIFLDMAEDYRRVKMVLPKLTLREFLIMWLRGKGNEDR